ncbi:MAG: ankyrin repeat domain-containing protein, partial [bacterium]
NSHGRTPLIEAAAAGHESMLVLLLSYGANVFRKDDLDMDALTAAAVGGFDRCVDVIVSHLPSAVVDSCLTGSKT